MLTVGMHVGQISATYKDVDVTFFFEHHMDIQFLKSQTWILHNILPFRNYFYREYQYIAPQIIKPPLI